MCVSSAVLCTCKLRGGNCVYVDFVATQVYFASSGEDAVKFESFPDEVVVAKAVAVLRSIFGDHAVPEVMLCMHFCMYRVCVCT